MNYQNMKNDELIDELKMKHNSELNIQIKNSLEQQQQLENTIKENESKYYENLKLKETEFSDIRYNELLLFENSEEKLLKKIKLLELKLNESNNNFDRLRDSTDLQIIQLKNELEKKRTTNLFNKHLPFSRFNNNGQNTKNNNESQSNNNHNNINEDNFYIVSAENYNNYPNNNMAVLSAENLMSKAPSDRDSLRSNFSYDAGDENDKTTITTITKINKVNNDFKRSSPITITNQTTTKTTLEICNFFNVDIDCATIFEGGIAAFIIFIIM